MKKFYQLSPDQRKIRIIAIIAMIFGVIAQIYYINQSINSGDKFGWSLFGCSLLVAVCMAIITFIVIIIGLMQKDRRVL